MVESCLPLQLSLAKQSVFLKVTLFPRGYPQQITGQYEVTKIHVIASRVAISERSFQPWTHCGIAEASTADAFFCCRENCSATLSLFNTASCTSLQVLLLNILQNKLPVFKHVCLEPNYKRRKYGRHTSVFFLMPWPGSCTSHFHSHCNS